jgi:YesN/AraC family two-component response regulator
MDPLLALKEFKPYYYDLLIVDINMPLINGYGLVESHNISAAAYGY